MSSKSESAATVKVTQRPRQNGRFCSPAMHAEGEPQAMAGKKDDRPVRCIHTYTNKELRKVFSKVFDGLAAKAAAGGVQQTRLLLQLGKFDDPKAKKQRGGKSLSAMLLEELKRRQDAREAAMEKAGDASTQPADGLQAGGMEKANDGTAAED